MIRLAATRALLRPALHSFSEVGLTLSLSAFRFLKIFKNPNKNSISILISPVPGLWTKNVHGAYFEYEDDSPWPRYRTNVQVASAVHYGENMTKCSTVETVALRHRT